MHKDADELFKAIGFVKGLKRRVLDYDWDNRGKLKESTRPISLSNPSDFHWFLENQADSSKIQFFHEEAREVVRETDSTVEIVVYKVKLSEGGTYSVCFKGEYNSWDDTSWYYEPYLVVKQKITKIVYVRLNENTNKGEDSSWD